LEAYIVDWLAMLARWLHIITGIAWIGASFYFIWLDNHLEPYQGPNKRIYGEVWSVHGGGFYHKQKYLVGPEVIPETLHWFKWEAYWTWISGTLLLGIVYWWGASAWLIDKSVADLSPGTAIAISAGSLVAGWVVYDLLCRFIRNDRVLGVVIYLLLVAAAWGFQQLFSARAAYIHVGAVIGTIMVWSVFFVIIPGQRKMVEAIKAGQVPDPAPGIDGKRRSVHNNYFTLPVLLIMISNHYPMTYGHKHAWLVLAALGAAAVLVRHFFNLRHKGRIAPGYPVAALLLMLLVAWLIAPAAPKAGEAVSFAQVRKVMDARCVSCHSPVPTQPGFAQPPGNIMLDTPDRVRTLAARINQQVVSGKVMPPGNLTGITDEERELIGRWVAQGARTD
jgi:uncharacterized membrane protein